VTKDKIIIILVVPVIFQALLMVAVGIEGFIYSAIITLL
jgi:hypothetical protein